MTDTFWATHPALSYSIMILLGLIVCWFVKREFNRFDQKLKEMCKSIGGKADKDENEKEHKSMWDRINHHEHTPKGKVVIVE